MFFFGMIILPNLSYAYPVFAQKSYPSGPREISGKLVCANCHLGEKEIETEIPRAVLPDTVFQVAVSIPYDSSITQISADGGRASVLVGSVLILPEGFELAPDDRLIDRQKDYLDNNYVQPYSSEQKNILLAGPVQPDEGDKEAKFIFPILSPNPAQGDTKFLNYGVFAGLNVGRGQVYPTGEKSNNNPYLSTVGGEVISVKFDTGRGKKVVIKTANGDIAQSVPAGLCISVEKGDRVETGDALTLDPNQGGFGQAATGLVLQNPRRVQGMIVFFFTVTIAQILLVIKKRQFEKVQLSEMNF
jgi:apocytochrome f